ncbi:subtilase 1.3 [Wolffia australiana]
MAASFLPWLLLPLLFAAAAAELATYIVHVSPSEKPAAFAQHLDWYVSAVRSTAEDAAEEAAERIVYSYGHAFHGFAARLSAAEAAALEEVPGVAAVFPETVYQLHTTRSPGFLGLESHAFTDLWSSAVASHDVIVGVLDTGIWPESSSFRDDGMGPVPARWKGACETAADFKRSSCNRKIIGARVFSRGYEASAGTLEARERSARDQDGHGTHTAATAAGAAVPGASFIGYAPGTARGMAPAARVAVYKVCWSGGCFSSDILSAVDRAVADGVDVLSISLGGGVSSYHRDGLSVAAFGAMSKGVFVACSAGNSGPDPSSLTNVAPWIATVGASSMDRDFPAAVRLGDGRNLTGASLYRGRRSLAAGVQYPLAYFGGNASAAADPRALCLDGALDPRQVAGKIVVCERGITARVQKGQVVKQAGGIGMVLANTAANGEELVADSHLLPAVAVGAAEGAVVKRYVKSAGRRATATLSFSGTRLGVRPSPVVAAFSSRGPNFLTMEVLKPDLVAPGVNILAAWSAAISPSSLPTDRRRVGFNILSGTSMSCPHVAGVAALVKARHPDWSPAAVKSALMTTAYVQDNTGRPMRDAATGEASGPYAHGAGHIDPARALEPGLVYDLSRQDYLSFLCTQGLTPPQMRVFAGPAGQACGRRPGSAGDLNYPSFSVVLSSAAARQTVRRTVTNVGAAASTYRVTVTPFAGAAVVVEPGVLRFSRRGQKLQFNVTFVRKAQRPAPEYGALTLADGAHSVRSAVVVTYLSPA